MFSILFTKTIVYGSRTGSQNDRVCSRESSIQDLKLVRRLSFVINANENPEFDHVVLVDGNDNPLGIKEKLRAHEDGGSLHRAFSIFVLNDKHEILVQQRAMSKYLCPGLWSNSCCSHPRDGREVSGEARERLSTELGFSTELEHIGTCTYKEPASDGLTEWELDHLFVGKYSENFALNPSEVESVRWSSLEALQNDLAKRPATFTPWLPHILPKFAVWFAESIDK